MRSARHHPPPRRAPGGNAPRCAAALFAGLLAALPASPHPQGPGTGAAARLDLPVAVRGQHGHVSGLEPSDLTIEIDGRPALIEAMREVDAGQAARGRQILLVFDLSGSGVASLLTARDAAVDTLAAALGPGDLVTVATLSRDEGVRLLLAASPDRRQLRRALDGLGVLDPDREPDPLLLAYDLRSPARPVPSDRDALAAALRARHRRDGMGPDALRAGSMRTLAELRALVTAFGGLPGPAHVAVFSCGFLESAPEGVATGVDSGAWTRPAGEGDPEADRSPPRPAFGGLVPDAELARRTRELADAARLAGVAVHVVQLEPPPSALGARRRLLRRLAGDTGGTIWRASDREGLARMLERTRRYYLVSLSVPVPSPAAVRVRPGRGQRAHHRTTFAGDLPGEPGLARLLRASAMLSRGERTGAVAIRGLGVRDGEHSVSFLLQLEGRPLLEDVEAAEVMLEVYAYAFDEDGELRDHLAIAPRLVLSDLGGALWRAGLAVETGFAAGPSALRVRALVMEGGTGRFGAAETAVGSAEDEARLALVAPPLFAEPRGQWVAINPVSHRGALWTAPFWLGGEAFVPNLFPRLERGRPARLCVLLQDPASALGPGTPLSFGVRLVDASGTARSPGAVGVMASEAEAGGVLRFGLSLDPADLEPGRYALRVRVVGPEGVLLAQGDQGVLVE